MCSRPYFILSTRYELVHMLAHINLTKTLEVGVFSNIDSIIIPFLAKLTEAHRTLVTLA